MTAPANAPKPTARKETGFIALLVEFEAAQAGRLDRIHERLTASAAGNCCQASSALRRFEEDAISCPDHHASFASGYQSGADATA
jgi:hypothetical protein